MRHWFPAHTISFALSKLQAISIFYYHLVLSMSLLLCNILRVYPVALYWVSARATTRAANMATAEPRGAERLAGLLQSGDAHMQKLEALLS